MKKSYYLDNTNISSTFTGTYKKLDSFNPVTIQESEAKKVNNTLDSDLTKKYSEIKKVRHFLKRFTQFFSIKDPSYNNGSKICNDEFNFYNDKKL
ncbi:MAG: hypothetical protein RLY40_1315 [Pseudomonadota bacterium]|jgi:hypothetical protein